MMLLPVDKSCPPPQWIEAVRAKFPTEREWDRILTGKQERRSGPGYAPLAVGDILEALQSFLRPEIEGEFSLSDEICRASWREGEWPHGEISGVAVYLKKKYNTIY